MPTIQHIRLAPVSFKLRQPFITSQGKKTKTHNLQVTVVLSNGVYGVAEGSSSIAMPGETQANMERAIKELVPELREKNINDYKALVQSCWRLQPFHPTAVAALESALIDA